MRIVKVNEISLIEKDIIQISSYEDFVKVYNEYFKESLAFDLNGNLYLIGLEVVYTFNSNELPIEEKVEDY